jgi:L-arabinose isomerase
VKQTMKHDSGASKNLGVLMFGRKRPGFDQEWSKAVREKCMATLTSLGYNVVGAVVDSPVTDDETIHASLDQIIAAKCEAIVIIQPSITDGQFAFTIAQRWEGPLVLWATPERPGDGPVSSCSLVGTHLFGSICRQAHFPFEFVYGDGDLIKDELVTTIALATTFYRLRKTKVGVIGIHAPGFIDLAADPFLIAQTFGLQMQSFSVPQFIDRVTGFAEPAVKDDMKEVEKYGLTMGDKSKPADKALATNSRFYLSLVEMMKESNLSGISLQCWPDLPNKIGQWPYFAVSRLLAEGQAISIEGDVDGAIGSIISNFLGFGPGFLTDWLEHDDDKIFFWHPGMAPLDMCQEMGGECEPTLGDHFNGKAPFVVDGPLQVGQSVTVARLWRCDNKYHMTAFEGKAIEPTKKVSGNSVLVEVDGGKVHDRFDELLHAAMPHHVTLYYGNHAKSFKRFARLLSIEWHG